jgi:signal peptidase I
MKMELKLLIAGVVLFILARIMRPLRDRIKAGKMKKVYLEIYEWIETGWSSVLLAAFLMYFFIQAFKIPSGSMRNTLLEGDHLFVNKFVYGFHIPLADGRRFGSLKAVSRGDIIVFKCPPEALTLAEREERVDKDFIKRCIAIGGDVVEIKNKTVFVNGNELKEDYTTFADPTVYQAPRMFPTSEQYQRAWESGTFANLSSDAVRDNFGPVIVPAGHYFCMGDNRDRSFDSRFWGPMPDKFLKGRALFLYWPLTRMRVVK